MKISSTYVQKSLVSEKKFLFFTTSKIRCKHIWISGQIPNLLTTISKANSLTWNLNFIISDIFSWFSEYPLIFSSVMYFSALQIDTIFVVINNNITTLNPIEKKAGRYPSICLYFTVLSMVWWICSCIHINNIRLFFSPFKGPFILI